MCKVRLMLDQYARLDEGSRLDQCARLDNGSFYNLVWVLDRGYVSVFFCFFQHAKKIKLI